MKNRGITIDLARCHYQTSTEAVRMAGLIPTDKKNNPQYVWVDGILSPEEALRHFPSQRINKIPKMDIICYKSTFFKCLNNMKIKYPYLYKIFPPTYILPDSYSDFQREHLRLCSRMENPPNWVIKPQSGCCGKGIKILQGLSEIQEISYKSVAQLYVDPFLINKKKFDFRFYVLIASLDPLVVFLYKEGIARFCTDYYEAPSRANRDQKFVHLTNTSINVANDRDPSLFTKKASEVLNQIKSNHKHNKCYLWNNICEVTRAAIIGIYPTMLASLPLKIDPIFVSKRKENKSSSVSRLFVIDDKPRTVQFDALPKRVFQSTMKTEINRTEVSMFVIPKSKKQQPIVVGSITNYQITTKPFFPSILSKSLCLSNFRRNQTSHQRSGSSAFDVDETTTDSNHTISNENLPSLDDKNHNNSNNNNNYQKDEESNNMSKDINNQYDKNNTKYNSDTEKDEENKKSDENSVELIDTRPPLCIKKRFFHILGIDIIINSQMEPIVLEINDRPSLSVTVDFEKDLKTSMLAESFMHVLPDGETAGECAESQWQQIFPQKKGDLHWSEWQDVVSNSIHPGLSLVHQKMQGIGGESKQRIHDSRSSLKNRDVCKS